MRVSAPRALLIASVLAGAALASETPARAAGCGGYVNVFVSGCAPWDNNARRMPGAPGYQAPRPAAPVNNLRQPTVGYTGTQRVVGQPATATGLISPGNRTGLVGNAGGTLISPGNRTGLVGNAGGTFISDQGGGFRR
ncbi:MAG: hypothetical protein K2X45_03760 [Phreatobacter sp.]|nr:hypothetical protein [Phreatobacter sp.]